MGVENKKGGYAIIFTMLIAGLILAMTLSMVNFSVHEFSFVRDIRQGNNVFGEMNGIMECVLYHDRHVGAFPFQGAYGTVSCGSNTTIQNGFDPGDGSWQFDFTIASRDDSNCVFGSVAKQRQIGTDAGGNPILGTVVDGTGYSTSCTSFDPNNLGNLTSRSLKYTYGN